MPERLRIFIDSGAFSAWRLGRAIDMNAYCLWLKQNEEWIDFYVALDAINPHDPEAAARASFENFMFMRRQGLNPIPVFHVRENFDWLKRILDTGCDYIGLSASSLDSFNVSDEWYEAAWSYLIDSAGAPLVRVHGFGESREPCLTKFPWTSGDGTTWIGVQQYGRLMLPDYNLWQSRTFISSPSAKDLSLVEGDDLIRLEADFARLGVRKEVFSDRKARSGTVARTYLAAHKWLAIENKARGLAPIRFLPGNRGLLFSSSPHVSGEAIEEQPFNYYFGIANNPMTLPVLRAAGARNLLVSYFYIPLDQGGLDLKAYLADEEAALHQPPYKRYTDMLDRDVLIAGRKTVL